MSESVKELTSSEFDSFSKEGLVLVDFYADWCMPCVMMAPVLEDVSAKLQGKLKIGKINVEESPEVAQKFGISSLPSFVVFDKGEVVDKFAGAMSAEELEEKLEEYL